jgi:hypothetical protein
MPRLRIEAWIDASTTTKAQKVADRLGARACLPPGSFAINGRNIRDDHWVAIHERRLPDRAPDALWAALLVITQLGGGNRIGPNLYASGWTYGEVGGSPEPGVTWINCDILSPPRWSGREWVDGEFVEVRRTEAYEACLRSIADRLPSDLMRLALPVEAEHGLVGRRIQSVDTRDDGSVWVGILPPGDGARTTIAFTDAWFVRPEPGWLDFQLVDPPTITDVEIELRDDLDTPAIDVTFALAPGGVVTIQC